MKHHFKSKRNKYGSKATMYNGRRFDSKLEASYCFKLDMAQKAGNLLFYLRQVPFELDGGVKYRCDFAEFWEDGEVKFTDCKGYDTKTGQLKIKQVEARYPVTINIVRKA